MKVAVFFRLSGSDVSTLVPIDTATNSNATSAAAAVPSNA
jgi:hypothetical protein